LELIGIYGFYDDMGISPHCAAYAPQASRESDPIKSYIARGIGDIEEFLSTWLHP
jgi:hypothetical protein